MKIRAGLTGLAVTAAALLGLSTPAREASSRAAAPTPAQDSAMLITTQAFDKREGRAAEGDSTSLAIQEAHSDGGYWYWRQAESRLPIQAAVRTTPPKL